jgi:hypothetical protein
MVNTIQFRSAYTRPSIGICVIASFSISACNSPADERVLVAGSNPQISCTLSEGAQVLRNAEAAVAHAKGAFASTYEKNPSSYPYSPTNIAKFEPYTATLRNGVWHIDGTVPAGYHGSVPAVSICRNDGAASISWTEVP